MSEDFLKAVAQPTYYEKTAQIVKVANPAAGAQFVVTVPGDQAWKVHAVTAVLTASAAVATRDVALLADDQSTTFLAAGVGPTQTAGQVATYSWARSLSTSTGLITGGVISAGFPDLVLPPGYRLRSTVVAMDVADQWSSIALYVEALDTLPFGKRQELEAAALAQYLAPYLQSQGA